MIAKHPVTGIAPITTYRTLLLVDDEPDILEVASMCFKLAGVQVFRAGSGQAALEIAARERPDVILLDAMMPDMDGPEVYRRLQADPETADIPVILLTAKLNVRHVAMTHVIHKPFDPGTLAAQVDRALVDMETQWGSSQRSEVASPDIFHTPGAHTAHSSAFGTTPMATRWRSHRQARVEGLWSDTFPDVLRRMQFIERAVQSIVSLSAPTGPAEAAQLEIWNVIAATELFGLTKAADMARQLEGYLQDPDDLDPANIICMQQLTSNIPARATPRATCSCRQAAGRRIVTYLVGLEPADAH